MSSDLINELASVHLGKAGDGTVVKPYVTPEEVDPSLLVGVPRYLNRTQYKIDEHNLPFVGRDAWNAYEFSTLLTNGFPLSGWLKFVYPADSEKIVESKSVKLYLNSYNMASLIESEQEIFKIEDMISDHLSKVVLAPVDVIIEIGEVNTVPPIGGEYTSLEEYCDVENIEFNHYNESPDILQIIPSNRRYERWRSRSLRSNCRVTNQPDWGDVFIHIKGQKTVTSESLLQYIVSMRKENHFHEEVCECIYKRLWDLLNPDELLVACLYTRRGGIDINPVRTSCEHLLAFAPVADPYTLATKTSRQ